MTGIIVSIVIDLGGLVLIWFLLRARIAKALEIDGLLAEARKEARLLTIEINETTDRNITLVEDSLTSLRELLAEADRRMGVVRREAGRRQVEGEVYSRLGRRAPVGPTIPSDEDEGPGGEMPRSEGPGGASPVPLVFGGRRAERNDSATRGEAGSRGEAQPRFEAAVPPPASAPVPNPTAAPTPTPTAPPRRPEISHSAASVIPPRSLRERAIELYRSGFSADIIAARLGATVSEIELLVSLEEGRAGMEEMGGT